MQPISVDAGFFPEMDIYSKIWEALESSDEWSEEFKPFNRIKRHEVKGAQRPDKANKADSDFPQADLNIRAGSSTLRTQHQAFANWGDGCSWQETIRSSYRLTMVSQLMKVAEPTNHLSLTMQALRKAGPRLGLEHVVHVSTSYNVSEADVESEGQAARGPSMLTGGMRRQITTVEIIVISIVQFFKPEPPPGG